MKYTSFFVEGKPEGKARPRVTTKGGFARAYTPEKTRKYEKRIADEYLYSGGEMYPEDAPIHMIILAYFAPPKSASKKRREDLLEHGRPMTKPDIDNIAKAVLDALNGVAYKDDKQVTDLLMHKYYGEQEGIKVVVSDGSK